MGSLPTAVTVTIFYMIVAEIWRLYFKRDRNIIWWILIIAGIVRLFIMIPQANLWGSVVPPFNWSIARNIPLIIQGIGIAVVLLVESVKANDTFIKKISIQYNDICFLCVLSTSHTVCPKSTDTRYAHDA